MNETVLILGGTIVICIAVAIILWRKLKKDVKDTIDNMP